MDIRILIVDDNPSFVAAVRQFLDFLPGVAVVGQACSSEDALGSGALLRPDLARVRHCLSEPADADTLA